MSRIPKNHPRYDSLITRDIIQKGLKKGLVHNTGLIAHGRGEAFDYLIGEETIPIADEAEKVAAASLLMAKNPVISVNGNVVILAGKDCVLLSKSIPSIIEVNLFHRNKNRIEKIIDKLKILGAEEVLGKKGDAEIIGLHHDRAICDKNGIFISDVILVPLEDGDRCEALKKMGKTVITIDLNPLSRTSNTAHITIVDNVTRAIPNIRKWVDILRDKNKKDLKNILYNWDNKIMLKKTLYHISKRLKSLYQLR
jgi:4-phosphopantoate--beta-alanine ligase